jgi:hypothetical protein
MHAVLWTVVYVWCGVEWAFTGRTSDCWRASFDLSFMYLVVIALVCETRVRTYTSCAQGTRTAEGRGT